MKSVIKITLETNYRCLIDYKSSRLISLQLWFNNYEASKIINTLELIKIINIENDYDGLVYAQDMIRIIGELKTYIKFHNPVLPKRFSCGNMECTGRIY